MIPLVALYEYEFLNDKEYNLPPRDILVLDKSIFDLFYKKYDTTKDTNVYWGYAKAKKIQKKAKEKKAKEKIKVVYKKDENLLCISSSCYRFLGLYYSKNTAHITFYNKDTKEKVKSYIKKEILQDDIFIAAIGTNNVLLKEKNSSREWKFEIFDINTTKYKPKESEL